MRTCRRFQEKEEPVLSSVASGDLRFNWIKERRHRRCAAQSQQHQTEVIGENKMRDGEKNPGKLPPAKIGKHCSNPFAKHQRRVLIVRALKKTAGWSNQYLN